MFLSTLKKVLSPPDVQVHGQGLYKELTLTLRAPGLLIFEDHVVPRVSSFLHGLNLKTEIVVWYGRNRVNRVLMSDVRSQRSLLLITRCSEINNFRFLTCSPIVPTLLLLHVTFNPKPSGAFKINCSIFIQNCSKVWLLEWNHVILWNSEWQSEIRDMSTFHKLRA